MVKNILLLLVGSILLVGCSNKPIKVKTEVQESFVPLLYCPKPSVPSHPTLPIHNMTAEQMAKDGEVVKHYKATIKLLQGHIGVLELQLKQYNMSNEAYDKLKSELIDKIKNGKLKPTDIKSK